MIKKNLPEKFPFIFNFYLKYQGKQDILTQEEIFNLKLMKDLIVATGGIEDTKSVTADEILFSIEAYFV